MPGLERLQLALEGGDLGELLVVLGEPLGHGRRRQAPLERTVALLVTEMYREMHFCEIVLDCSEDIIDGDLLVLKEICIILEVTCLLCAAFRALKSSEVVG